MQIRQLNSSEGSGGLKVPDQTPHPELLQIQIRLLTSSTVPESLSAAAYRGIQKALALIPDVNELFQAPAPDQSSNLRVDHLLEDAIAKGDFRHARNGIQLDADKILWNLLGEYKDKKSGWPILLCNQDLMHPKWGWVFGLATDIVCPTSVQSVARFMNPRISDGQRELAVERLLAHEVGHMIGLVNRKHDVEDRYGLHCTNVCAMRQAETPMRWIKLAEEEHNKGIDFCGCCRGEVVALWGKSQP